MRISDWERKVLVAAVRAQDPGARVWLFGSRVDDGKRGGDIDIAILSSSIERPESMRIRSTIVEALGEQKIDVIVSMSDVTIEILERSLANLSASTRWRGRSFSRFREKYLDNRRRSRRKDGWSTPR